MKKINLFAAITFALLATPAAAQDHSAHGGSAKPAVEAFAHYEGVRVALSSDKFAEVATHATALAAVAQSVGGAEAKKAADALVQAKTIEDARKGFGELSVILLPKFQEAGIEGAHAFMCDMKKRPWMQRGDKPENPYYGKAMLTCGSALPSKGK